MGTNAVPRPHSGPPRRDPRRAPRARDAPASRPRRARLAPSRRGGSTRGAGLLDPRRVRVAGSVTAARSARCVAGRVAGSRRASRAASRVETRLALRAAVEMRPRRGLEARVAGATAFPRFRPPEPPRHPRSCSPPAGPLPSCRSRTKRPCRAPPTAAAAPRWGLARCARHAQRSRLRACSLRTHSLAACLTAHAACNHQAGGRDRVRHRRARAHSREPARPRRRSRERAGLCERLLRRLEQGRAKGQLAHSGAAAAAAAAQRWRRCDGALRRRVSSASRRRCSVGPWSSSSTTASPALPDTLTPPCPSSGKCHVHAHV